MTPAEAAPRSLALIAAVLLAAGFVWFVAPGVTVSAVYTGDVFVLFDGIHRLAAGQWPSRDFSTPLGALAYALPAWGARLAGGIGGALEWASWLVAAGVLAMALVLIRGRAGPAMAVILLVVIWGTAMIPLVPGEVGFRVTPAMPYNRWGWAALTALFLAGIPRARPGDLAEATAMALLLLFLALVKASFFAVGGAFLLGLAIFEAGMRRAALLALTATALGLAALELATGLVSANIADLRTALAASGAVRDSLLRETVATAHEYALVAIGYGVALALGRLGWRDALFAAFVLLSGAAILNQNFQDRHVVTLVVPFAALARRLTETDAARLPALLAGAFLAPNAANWALASAVVLTAGQAERLSVGLPELERVHLVASGRLPAPPAPLDPALRAALDLPEAAAPMAPPQAAFVHHLAEAVELLKRDGVTGGPLFVFDFQNAVALPAGLPPQPGGYSWLHAGRTISDTVAMAPEVLFRGVDHALVPVNAGTDPALLRLLLGLYGPYLAEAFELRAASPRWRLYSRRGLSRGPRGDAEGAS